MKARLESTKDYSIFEMHPFNRDIADKPKLKKSMITHGFMPSKPLQCIKNGNGKLKVVAGHHRLYYAKQLGIEVYYVVDDSNTDIFNLEGDSNQRWTLQDFAIGSARAGDKNCRAVLEFAKKHGISIRSSASLLGGENAKSGNKSRMIKNGTFKIYENNNAESVGYIVDICREMNLQYATMTSFVSAVDMALRVSGFDSKTFISKLRKFPGMMIKRATVDEYLDEIEKLYNYASKAKHVHVKVEAREISKQRSLINNTKPVRESR